VLIQLLGAQIQGEGVQQLRGVGVMFTQVVSQFCGGIGIALSGAPEHMYTIDDIAGLV